MLIDRVCVFDRILSRPDPSDLPKRGHHLTCEGHPSRRQRLAIPLAVAFLQHHYLTVDELSAMEMDR